MALLGKVKRAVRAPESRGCLALSRSDTERPRHPLLMRNGNGPKRHAPATKVTDKILTDDFQGTSPEEKRYAKFR